MMKARRERWDIHAGNMVVRCIKDKNVPSIINIQHNRGTHIENFRPIAKTLSQPCLLDLWWSMWWKKHDGRADYL